MNEFVLTSILFGFCFIGHSEAACKDETTWCPVWADAGFCTHYPHFMTTKCCYTCSGKRCRDTPIPKRNCARMAERGWCIDECRQAYMRKHCCRTCRNTPCKDKNLQCRTWAKRGECKINPAYMLPNCCKSCKAKCVDNQKKCKRWAERKPSACVQYSAYMIPQCCKSCKAIIKGQPRVG